MLPTTRGPCGTLVDALNAQTNVEGLTDEVLLTPQYRVEASEHRIAIHFARRPCSLLGKEQIMPKTRTMVRKRRSEQKRNVRKDDPQNHKGHFGGQGMGQGRGMNPGEVHEDRPGGQPGQADRNKGHKS